LPFVRPESALYPLVHRWLQADFKASEAMRAEARNAVTFTDNIAEQGTRHGGLWSQPDLAAVVYAKARYLPHWTADLYSFEVKTGDGIGQEAVYEAFAHTRFVNFSYLVWQVPIAQRDIDNRVLDLCQKFGLGALITPEPDDPRSYRVVHTPLRRETPPSTFDQFISERFSEQTKRAIQGWLSAAGWAQDGRQDGRY
jgi:hypothetical protein